MQRLLMSAALVGVLVCGTALAESVTLDGMTSKVPASWVEETPSNKMRAGQFRLPKVEGDKNDAELIIFKGLGGTVSANVERWKKQFRAPEGKSIDDLAKVEKIKIGGHEATQLTVEGTFLYNPAPFNPASKTEARPNYKMIAIHFTGPEDIYHIKLTGPAKTVDKHQKAFEEWIKGFKK
jgi:hypothetical protein